MQNKLNIFQYLETLYKKDKYISNTDAWHLLKAVFPDSKANMKALLCWKSKLRKMGVDIPYQKEQKKGKE